MSLAAQGADEKVREGVGRGNRRQQSLHLTAVLCSVRKWLDRAGPLWATLRPAPFPFLLPLSANPFPFPLTRSGGDICRRQTCEILSQKFCAGRAPFIMRPPLGEAARGPRIHVADNILEIKMLTCSRQHFSIKPTSTTTRGTTATS